PVVTTPPPVSPPPTPTPRPAPAEPAPFYTDLFGDVLVGAGILALGIGTYYYFSAQSLENNANKDADSATGVTYQQHLDRIDRAESHRTRSVIFAGAGIALITGGVLRYVLHARAPETTETGWNRSRNSPRPWVDAWAAPNAGGIAVGGAF